MSRAAKNPDEIRLKYGITLHPDTVRIINRMVVEVMQRTGDITSFSLGESYDMFACYWAMDHAADDAERERYRQILLKHGMIADAPEDLYIPSEDIARTTPDGEPDSHAA